MIGNFINHEAMNKWRAVLEHKNHPTIQDPFRKSVTAQLLENLDVETKDNYKASILLGENANFGGLGIGRGAIDTSSYTGTVAGADPILISMIRRAMPILMAYDICGVQALDMPTGIIFATKARYGSQDGGEALFYEADTSHGGEGTHNSWSDTNNPFDHSDSSDSDGVFSTGRAMSTRDGELLGSNDGVNAFDNMAFSIERVTVEAKSRGLRTEYTQELARDMMKVHKMDAMQHLSDILSRHILASINREVVRTIYKIAKPGAQESVTTAGVFDMNVDSDGRHADEKFKGLLYRIDMECNNIGQETREDRGNFIICSAHVASALRQTGRLTYAPQLVNNLQVNDTKSTFCGALPDGTKVFVDPYAANVSNTQFFVAGYKGATPGEAGLFYCPYVPLEKYVAVDPKTMQPALAFKSRYGIIDNPHVALDAFQEELNGAADDAARVQLRKDWGANAGNDFILKKDKNYFYRKVKVTNIQ